MSHYEILQYLIVHFARTSAVFLNLIGRQGRRSQDGSQSVAPIKLVLQLKQAFEEEAPQVALLHVSFCNI